MYLGVSSGDSSTYLLHAACPRAEAVESADIIGTNGPVAHRKIIRFRIVDE